jgi:hypothetical protein
MKPPHTQAGNAPLLTRAVARSESEEEETDDGDDKEDAAPGNDEGDEESSDTSAPEESSKGTTNAKQVPTSSATAAKAKPISAAPAPTTEAVLARLKECDVAQQATLAMQREKESKTANGAMIKKADAASKRQSKEKAKKVEEEDEQEDEQEEEEEVEQKEDKDKKVKATAGTAAQGKKAKAVPMKKAKAAPRETAMASPSKRARTSPSTQTTASPPKTAKLTTAAKTSVRLAGQAARDGDAADEAKARSSRVRTVKTKLRVARVRDVKTKLRVARVRQVKTKLRVALNLHVSSYLLSVSLIFLMGGWYDKLLSGEKRMTRRIWGPNLKKNFATAMQEKNLVRVWDSKRADSGKPYGHQNTVGYVLVHAIWEEKLGDMPDEHVMLEGGKTGQKAEAFLVEHFPKTKRDTMVSVVVFSFFDLSVLPPHAAS